MANPRMFSDDDYHVDDYYEPEPERNHGEMVICATCNGSGEGMYDGSVCSTCRGKGEVWEETEPLSEEDENE